MPRLSSEEGTATLSAWLVAVGDRVEKGGLIAELETDKATVELEAPVEGRIDVLLVPAGTEGLKPGALLGRIFPLPASTESHEEIEERVAAEAEAASPADAEGSAAGPEPRSDAKEMAAASKDDGIGRSAATPLARRLAEVRGIDLGQVTGTGVGGRIVQADIERSVQTPETGRGTEAEAVALRQGAGSGDAGIGPRSPAHLVISCAMDAIVAARVRLNADLAARSSGARISLNDFVVRAVGLALRDVAAANLRRSGEGVEPAPAVDVALVVAGDAGPQTVVLRDADRKGLAVLSQEIRSRIGALASESSAQTRPESESAASVVVTSFARFGIESAYPMLPREQVLVLGVGTVLERPVVRDGALTVGWTLTLTLGFDPRAIGGAVAAELLGVLRGHLEDPLSMML